MSEWKAARVGDICKAANGRAFKPTEWDTEGAPIIRIQNLKNDSAPFNYFRGEIEPRFRVQRGDLLFAWSGTPGTSFGAHIWRGGDAVLNQHIFNLHFDRKKIDERFFCYALNRNVADYVAKAQGGVGLAHITKGKFEDSFVPLPDIVEQRAVVAELEKQFSRLDEAVAGLKRVKANLKRYKAAILKAAVEGRLVETEADLARREGRDYETGAQLLQRILETRRSKWQGKGKYKEPAATDITDLPELPEGWVWSSIAQVSDVASGSTPSGILDAVRPTGDIPWFKVGDMNHADNQQFLRHSDAWLSAAEVKVLSLRVFPPATVLFPKRGGAIATNKKRQLSAPGCVDLNVMGITPNAEIAGYFFRWFEGVDLARLSDGSNVPQINHKDIDPLAVPIPPLPEQHGIVAEVDRLLSIAREAETEVEINLKRAHGLRHAILQREFDLR